MSNGSPWESPDAAADYATLVARTTRSATGDRETEAANVALGQTYLDLIADPSLAVRTLDTLAQRVTLLTLREYSRGNPAPMSTFTDGSLGKDPVAEGFVRAHTLIAMSEANGDQAGVEAGTSHLRDGLARGREFPQVAAMAVISLANWMAQFDQPPSDWPRGH